MDDKRRIFIKQFIIFNYVGALTIIIGTFVFVLMIALGFGYIISLVGDYTAGILFSYFMNKNYTFGVKLNSDLLPLVKTASMYIVSFMLNVILLKLCSEVYGYNIIYSQFVIIFVLALFNFMVFKLVIFRVVNERKI